MKKAAVNLHPPETNLLQAALLKFQLEKAPQRCARGKKRRHSSRGARGVALRPKHSRKVLPRARGLTSFNFQHNEIRRKSRRRKEGRGSAGDAKKKAGAERASEREASPFLPINPRVSFFSLIFPLAPGVSPV